MTSGENILVELLKSGITPVAVVFMMFIFLKTLWKKIDALIDKNMANTENNALHTKALEESNRLTGQAINVITDFITKQDKINEHFVSVLSDVSQQISSCNLANTVNGGDVPLKRKKKKILETIRS
jgi:hypothetical protein